MGVTVQPMTTIDMVKVQSRLSSDNRNPSTTQHNTMHVAARVAWSALSGGVRRGYATASSASTTTGVPIGFIGLGNMGGHMARNLLKAGRQVTVFDVAPQAAASLKDAGAMVAQSPAEAAAGAGVVVTMVPSNPHVREVYCGTDGVFSVMAPGTLCIDSSTVDPAVSKEMASVAAEHGGSFMDAPVSGGT